MIKIPGTIYPNNIYAFIGNSVDELEKFLIKSNLMVSQEDFETLNLRSGYTMKFSNGYIVIYVQDKTNIPVIAHEVFHATEYIMEEAGIVHCDESSEAFAYLLEYILEKILKSNDK